MSLPIRSSSVLGQQAIACPTCNTATTATVFGLRLDEARDPDGHLVGPKTQWAFGACQRCGGPTVLLREELAPDHWPVDFSVYYPSPARLSIAVPASLRKEFEEARKCMDAKAYTACVVMVRRTLEAICGDLGVKPDPLAAALDQLGKDGLLDETLLEWATVLRLAGNQAAHISDRDIERVDAEAALAFAEAFLDHIYVLRRKFDEFKKRLNASS